jgi:hypothetical protein
VGANGYLVKPSDVKRLQDMTKAIKNFSLTQNTPPPEFHEQEVTAGLTHETRRETPGHTRQVILETLLDNNQ